MKRIPLPTSKKLEMLVVVEWVNVQSEELQALSKELFTGRQALALKL